MRPTAVAVLAIGLLAAASCSKPAQPTPYTNAQWGFGVTFPAAPKVTETPGGNGQTHSLLAEARSGDDDFAVVVYDAGNSDEAPSAILDRAQDAVAQQQEVDVGASTPVTLGDISGREVRFDKDGKPAMLSRLFMINGRLYEVNANSAKGTSDPREKAFCATRVTNSS